MKFLMRNPTLHARVARRIRKGGDVNDTAADVIAIVQSDPSAAARALRSVNTEAQQEAARRNGRRGGRPGKCRNCGAIQPARWVMCDICGHERATPQKGE